MKFIPNFALQLIARRYVAHKKGNAKFAFGCGLPQGLTPHVSILSRHAALWAAFAWPSKSLANAKSGFIPAVILLFFSFVAYPRVSLAENAQIRYVVIGDSYSIGTGVNPKEAWPVLLTEQLRADGFDISLVANPSRNGWTTVDAQQWEIPVLRKSEPTFATLMIGVNDWLQNSTQERFRANFTDLLDDMLSELPANKIVVINIPDFSLTLKGSTFSPGRDIPKGIAKFNKIIAQVCKEKAVSVVDIFTASQKMRLDLSLTASDGLHPSAKGQLLFAQTIYPLAKKVLNDSGLRTAARKDF